MMQQTTYTHEYVGVKLKQLIVRPHAKAKCKHVAFYYSDAFATCNVIIHLISESEHIHNSSLI